MEIPLRFRQLALLPTALVLILMSFPLSIVVHDVVEGILASMTGQASTLLSMVATFGALGAWAAMIWFTFKWVQTGGLGLLD